MPSSLPRLPSLLALLALLPSSLASLTALTAASFGPLVLERRDTAIVVVSLDGESAALDRSAGKACAALNARYLADYPPAGDPNSEGALLPYQCYSLNCGDAALAEQCKPYKGNGQLGGSFPLVLSFQGEPSKNPYQPKGKDMARQEVAFFTGRGEDERGVEKWAKKAFPPYARTQGKGESEEELDGKLARHLKEMEPPLPRVYLTTSKTIPR
jgi:hypothetical protein